MKASAIREILKWVAEGNVISFGGGMPDPSTFPVEEIGEILDAGLREEGDVILQYGTTEGLRGLREELVRFMAWRGVEVPGIDNLVVVSGSQQGLDMLGRVLIDEGDVILMELPTYLAAINAFQFYHPRFVGLRMDDEGIEMDALEETLKGLRAEGRRAKLLYTVPTCQNPAGITLSLDRRRRLMELASEHDLLVVEDDPYSFFTYEPVEIRHLKSLDGEGRVIYMSTFSKILSPGLRLGWIAADEGFIEKLVMAKQSMDLCTSPLVQYIAYGALRDGVIRRKLPESRELYRRKRDRMLAALERHMPEGCRWTRPIGGLFIFAWAPEGVDTGEMIMDSVRKHGVAYVPGRGFYVDGSGANTMRLNFTYPSMEQIDEGIERLGEAIEERLG
ncbi:aminotransferase [miscellaneous Crenarchaeota group-15 archaeon DG-45]|uniref:Aminotransferase n=1 Tax=miscellaneous Crenarchaeota group-15 archaeon DG-45 TaxID=1685127 RepID=A0A0M0BQW2_9ARCH|nr:MAG: aminotransferase [miscellaneous Crenarchaeota group-15 archaeon DG-45]